jgi:hypothetical protein
VFPTPEDETGFVTVALWPLVGRRSTVLGNTARVLGVTGARQRQAGVVHLLATQVWSPRLPRFRTTSTCRIFAGPG